MIIQTHLSINCISFASPTIIFPVTTIISPWANRKLWENTSFRPTVLPPNLPTSVLPYLCSTLSRSHPTDRPHYFPPSLSLPHPTSVPSHPTDRPYYFPPSLPLSHPTSVPPYLCPILPLFHPTDRPHYFPPALPLPHPTSVPPYLFPGPEGETVNCSYVRLFHKSSGNIYIFMTLLRYLIPLLRLLPPPHLPSSRPSSYPIYMYWLAMITPEWHVTASIHCSDHFESDGKGWEKGEGGGSATIGSFNNVLHRGHIWAILLYTYPSADMPMRFQWSILCEASKPVSYCTPVSVSRCYFSICQLLLMNDVYLSRLCHGLGEIYHHLADVFLYINYDELLQLVVLLKHLFLSFSRVNNNWIWMQWVEAGLFTLIWFYYIWYDMWNRNFTAISPPSPPPQGCIGTAGKFLCGMESLGDNRRFNGKIGGMEEEMERTGMGAGRSFQIDGRQFIRIAPPRWETTGPPDSV